MKHQHENTNSGRPDFPRGMGVSVHMSEKGKRPYRDKFIPIGVRLVLGVVFVYASLDKILYPYAFSEAVYNYQVLPDSFINLTVIILPWLECIIGICLILGVWLSGSVLLGTILLTTFFGALLFNVIRGLNIDCGCFSRTNGAISDVSMVWYIIRDGVFLILALYLFSHIFFWKKPAPGKKTGQ